MRFFTCVASRKLQFSSASAYAKRRPLKNMPPYSSPFPTLRWRRRNARVQLFPVVTSPTAILSSDSAAINVFNFSVSACFVHSLQPS